jgi:hypothetical protein
MVSVLATPSPSTVNEIDAKQRRDRAAPAQDSMY